MIYFECLECRNRRARASFSSPLPDVSPSHPLSVLKLKFAAFSGSVSVCATQSAILVHNMAYGFDLYEMKDDAIIFVRRFRNRCQQGPNIRLPSVFVHGGNSLSGGSTCGGIRVWMKSDDSRFLSLKLDGASNLSFFFFWKGGV